MIHHRILIGLIWVTSLVGLGAMFVGCSNDAHLSGLVPARGVVTHNGIPVDGASIIFIPTGTMSGEQRSASATSGSNGEFEMMTLHPRDGVFPGEYTVLISKNVPDRVLTEEELSRSIGVAPPTFTNMLPSRYSNLDLTPLSITIEGRRGNTAITFELTD